MNRRILLASVHLCVAILVLLAPMGCASSEARSGEQFDGSIAGTETQTSQLFSDMINDFGVALLMKSAEKETGNVIVSPASVHAALSMTSNGATGDTAKQMHDVLLSNSMTAEEANTQWASLLKGLNSPRPGGELDIANAVWGREGVAFEKPFVAANRDFFGAQLDTLDFAQSDVAGAVNQWAKANTHGMITRVVDKVPANAVLYLANAVYFKGDWATPFRASSTQESEFTRSDGSKVSVQMMYASRDLPFAESGTLQATRLSYKGADTAYYVLLPREGVRLDAAAASLDRAGFADLKRTMDTAATAEVVLGLPKLDAEFTDDLASALSEMGMPLAFDPQRARFSGIAGVGQPLWIDSVQHATKVRVDEAGTEAAAATAVAVAAGMGSSSTQPHQIICDRPYLFAIVDEGSGTMLFLGVVRDPME